MYLLTKFFYLFLSKLMIWTFTMKIKFSLMVFLFINSLCYSQFDNGNKALQTSPIKNTPISKSKSTSSKFSPISPITPNFKDIPVNKEPEIIFQKIGGSKPIDLTMKSDFVNPGAIYQEKLNKNSDGEVTQEFRRNQNLGDFKTKSLFVKILCRDNQFVDGDRVRIYINDLIIQENVLLEGFYQTFEITLKNGFNKIDIEAINQGSSGPNTAEFQVFDDKGASISANQWNLSTGFKATIVIVKE
jgi:hypothetical protein